MKEIITSPMPATPVSIDSGHGCCLGWFHAASQSARAVGIVLCRPLGYEVLCTYGAYSQLATTLAAAGFHVIRFDYHGTGDSAGDDADPDRVGAWRASILAAAAEIKKLAHVEQLVFFGMRMGATLAAAVAEELGGIESLVMWAPCRTGRSFVRELTAARSVTQPAASAAANGSDPGMDSLGFYYSGQTLEQLKALDCTSAKRSPAKNVLILNRDDMPPDKALQSKYVELGANTSQITVEGYELMMREPRETAIPPATLAAILDWLQAAHPIPAAPLAPVPFGATALPAADCVIGEARESPVRFGTGDALFGILAEPSAASSVARFETAVLMLNVGGNYHIGPHRIYVKMARELAAWGYRALRFDLTGIGDSRNAGSFSFGSLYSRNSTPDVQSAIDFLHAKGCKRFYLLGICSGSYVAFQTARVDPRVTGQVLMNSRLLEWQDESAAGDWQRSMQNYYKSSDYYWNALTQPGVYRRLLRGEVDVRGISKRMLAVVQARLKRGFKDLLHSDELAEGVLAQAQRVAARGTDTLMIMAAEDDGRDYVEFHFGKLGSRMRGEPLFTMVLVDGTDHTFSDRTSQKFVFGTLKRHLDKALIEPYEPAAPARGGLSA